MVQQYFGYWLMSIMRRRNPMQGVHVIPELNAYSVSVSFCSLNSSSTSAIKLVNFATHSIMNNLCICQRGLRAIDATIGS